MESIAHEMVHIKQYAKGDDKANEGNSEEPSESEEVVDEVAESEDTGSSNEENVDQSSDEVKEDKAVEQNEEVKE